MTSSIERFRRILKLMPSTAALPFADCSCAEQGEPSPWFHQTQCPVCIEFWQHHSAACEAVDAAMKQEQAAY